MLTCKKSYRDIPFAHRQHHHDGHCALIHGHNWAITLTFACTETDVNGFVVDFGKLKYLKEWIDLNLDHACVLNEDDPEKDRLIRELGGMIKHHIVPNCSCEGLAQYIHQVFDPQVRTATAERAWIVSVEIEEDSKNSACFLAE